MSLHISYFSSLLYKDYNIHKTYIRMYGLHLPPCRFYNPDKIHPQSLGSPSFQSFFCTTGSKHLSFKSSLPLPWEVVSLSTWPVFCIFLLQVSCVFLSEGLEPGTKETTRKTLVLKQGHLYWQVTVTEISSVAQRYSIPRRQLHVLPHISCFLWKVNNRI